MKETIGDADFLVVSECPTGIMEFFTSMPEVIDVMGAGKTKSSVKLNTGMDADIRILPEKSFGSALQYFTGSTDHNIALRRIARQKDFRLNEYGLFAGSRQIAGRTEEEIYEKLELRWIPPELRENAGEIEAARDNRLPHLITYRDLKGDLQVHSNWTDGVNSIQEMADEAEKIGLEYILISDHSKTLGVARGLDEAMLLRQGEEIDQLNDNVDITILKGVELNILKDGSLDIADHVLEQLDLVGAAVHSHFNLSRDEMTGRIVKALENPNVDMLYHPTTRLIQRRKSISLDVETIIDAAKDNQVILDIDAYPNRLDLKDEYIRKAVEIGAKLGISSDAHNRFHFHFLDLGVAQARRGWATAKDVVNTGNVTDLMTIVK
jgi:DNA polymerase (family 10)